MQKSLKSIQLVLNSFFQKIALTFVTVTASAFTQSRNKLLPTGFIELNKQAIVAVYYQDNDYSVYRGFRLLGIDGSQIRLPESKEICRTFGTIRINSRFEGVKEEYPVAVASVLYDVLNNIPIDAILAPAKSYEVNLALEHLEHVTSKDLLLFDRGYIGYIFLAQILKRGVNFLGRCSEGSFLEAQKMFKSVISSKIVTLNCPRYKKKEAESLGLELTIQVRFVRVILDTGEVEVLVTSLLDEEAYGVDELKELYYQRWGIETFYGTIKGRLNLENFTGKTVESVKQDFHATIFISGLETILTEEAQEELDKRSQENKYPQAVNKAVSFNAIKENIIELFYQETDRGILLEKLTSLFMTNPICVRKGRKVERKKSSFNILVNYHRRKKKICF